MTHYFGGLKINLENKNSPPPSPPTLIVFKVNRDNNNKKNRHTYIFSIIFICKKKQFVNILIKPFYVFIHSFLHIHPYYLY